MSDIGIRRGPHDGEDGDWPAVQPVRSGLYVPAPTSLTSMTAIPSCSSCGGRRRSSKKRAVCRDWLAGWGRPQHSRVCG